MKSLVRILEWLGDGRVVLFSVGMMAVASFTTTGWGQLEFTEIMNNTLDADEADWEWVEVRNNFDVPIDLDGYVFYDQSNHTPLLEPNISAAMSPTTFIPENGVAVLYNGRNLGTDGARFRSAWNLDPSVPLIAVQGQVPGLNNGGDRIALWASLSDYMSDIEDPDMDLNFAMTASPSSTASLLDFTSGFPLGVGISMQWSGTGSNGDSLNWSPSITGANGAYQSTMTVTPGDLVGVGNPGTVPGGAAPAGKLVITEIMYNPAAPEAENEWVEVVNNTGSAIDFGSNPYTIYDHDLADLMAENVTSGTIQQGETAILYSDDIDPADMEAAWGAGRNYIPVSDWLQGNSGMANGGDEIGIWSTFSDYEADALNNAFDLADATVAYDDDPGGGWPQDNNQSSIWLASLDSDPTMGLSWFLSDELDGMSFAATLDLVDHSGEDVGSPGVFNPTTGGADCDFNGSGTCDIADLDLMYAELGSSNPMFDLDSDGDVDNDDVTQWLTEASSVDAMGRTFQRGDADLNGNVEGPDFTTLALNFGNEGLWGDGNFVVDAVAGGGTVGGPDFTQLALNFGFTSAVNSVPEPGSLALWISALLALLGMTRSRR